MTEKARRIKLGPPLERETKMGPVVSKEQYERVRSYQDLAKRKPSLPLAAAAPKSSPGLLCRAHYLLRHR